MHNRLKVCLVTQQLGSIISGIGHITRTMLTRMLDDRHDVTVIAPIDQKPEGQSNFQFIGVPGPFGANSQARWLSLSWNFKKALEQLSNRQFDLTYFTDAREAFFSTRYSPIIGMVNDTYAAEIKTLDYYRKFYADWLSRWAYYHLLRRIERFTYPRLSALVTNSRHTASSLQKIYALNSEQIHVCYCGIEPQEYTAQAERSPRVHNPRILFIGGNMQRKGLPTLIEAAPAILAAIPQAEFWVIGKDRMESGMQEIGTKLGVSEHFNFWGHQPHQEIPKFFSKSAVFVLPSLTEAFGIVLLEAMAAKVPVIGTRVGGIPEIIDHGINGLLVEPNNPQELAKAVIQILSEPELASQFQRAGLKTVEKFKAVDVMSCNYRVFESVLDAARSR